MDSLNNETLKLLREIAEVNEKPDYVPEALSHAAETPSHAAENEPYFVDNPIPSGETILLDVGGRKFKTRTSTLIAESEFFRNLFALNIELVSDDEEAYFVDSDPDMFEHLLRFMRRPSRFPLFYDTARGFDHELYARLGEEAKHFGVTRLYDWIREKQYLDAVKVKIDAPVIRDLSQLVPECNTGNVTYERHLVSVKND